jgi:Calcineurin-like phosphoesterase
MSRRAAITTDRHGNMPALEDALRRIEQLGIDEVYCGGDLVGYGPRPNEVCALVAERRIPTIYGRASFALLTANERGVSVSIERVGYDAVAVARMIRDVGLAGELAEQLMHATWRLAATSNERG